MTTKSKNRRSYRNHQPGFLTNKRQVQEKYVSRRKRLIRNWMKIGIISFLVVAIVFGLIYAINPGYVFGHRGQTQDPYTGNWGVLTTDRLAFPDPNDPWQLKMGKEQVCVEQGSLIITALKNYAASCYATSTMHTAITYQMDMIIDSGGNDSAAGLVFGVGPHFAYQYHVAFTPDGLMSTAYWNSINGVMTLDTNSRHDTYCPSWNKGYGQSNTIAVLVGPKTVYVYVNQSYCKAVPVTRGLPGGMVGVIAFGDNKKDTVAEFQNMAVWDFQ